MADVVVEGSHVNLTRQPIICAIRTDKPLPPGAWAVVGELAKAVDKAARMLAPLIEGDRPPDG